MEFDFIDHQLVIRTSDGVVKSVALAPRSVADFYADVMATLTALGLPVKIWPVAVEVPVPIRLDTDEAHRAYDRGAGESLLDDPVEGRARLRGLALRLRRQVQPGAFLLGRVRSRGDAVLGASGAAARRSRRSCARPTRTK